MAWVGQPPQASGRIVAVERFPLHRSLIFWLGLPGLLFLLWAWVDSAFHVTVWSRGLEVHGPTWIRIGPEGDSIRHACGRVEVHFHSEEMASPDHSVSVVYLKPDFSRRGVGGRSLYWRPELETEVVAMRSGFRMLHRTVTIPHWVIIAGYLAGWYGLLMWRRRAKRRTMQSLPQPEPGPAEASANPEMEIR